MRRILYGHPLCGADLRLRRARQNIGTLNRQLQRWTDAHGRQPIRATVDEAERKINFSVPVAREEVELLHRATISVGETAYNVRSALDYLVYSIARGSNSGHHVSGTQFPMEDSEDGYWSRWTGKAPDGRKIRRYLNKVPKDVANDLAHYQPFAHCVWIELLKDISNPDKHSQLTIFNSETQLIPHRLRGYVNPHTGTQAIDFEGVVRVDVTLTTGEDVVEALQLIHSEAAALIRSYSGHFQLNPSRFV